MEFALDRNIVALDLLWAAGALAGLAAVAGMRLGLALVGAVVAMLGVGGMPSSPACAPECSGIDPLLLLAGLGLLALAEFVWDARRGVVSPALRWLRVVTAALVVAVGLALLVAMADEQGAIRTPMTVDTAIALLAAVVGGSLAYFGALAALELVDGATRRGGHRPTLSAFVTIGALIAVALSAFVPAAGFLVAGAVTFLALRVRRRSRTRYKGLRILT